MSQGHAKSSPRRLCVIAVMLLLLPIKIPSSDSGVAAKSVPSEGVFLFFFVFCMSSLVSLGIYFLPQYWSATLTLIWISATVSDHQHKQAAWLLKILKYTAGGWIIKKYTAMIWRVDRSCLPNSLSPCSISNPELFDFQHKSYSTVANTNFPLLQFVETVNTHTDSYR